MIRKLLTIVALLTVAFTANAQFEAGKFYANGSLTGLTLNYNGDDGFTFGVQARGGYMVEKDWLIIGQASFNNLGSKNNSNIISLGAGLRYYIEQNGLFLGVNCNYIHASHTYNDIMPGIEIGYCYFLSRTVTIEPSVYYDQSFNNHSKYSTVGLKIGVGVYL